ncbi:hypothetical protein JB92DRAFT_3026743, partial [Gautieria morchelliformis]
MKVRQAYLYLANQDRSAWTWELDYNLCLLCIHSGRVRNHLKAKRINLTSQVVVRGRRPSRGRCDSFVSTAKVCYELVTQRDNSPPEFGHHACICLVVFENFPGGNLSTTSKIQY